MECQRCRKFPITMYKEKVFKECSPLYDEQCSTKYHKHCKTTRKCTQIYQTVCQKDSGYQQTCSQFARSSPVVVHDRPEYTTNSAISVVDNTKCLLLSA